MRVEMRRRRARRGRLQAQPFRFSGTVQVDGNSIFYQTAGSGEGNRHTLVLVHGTAGSSECWHEQIEDLSDELYLVAPDLPAHGQSEGQAQGVVRDYADFLYRFLDALGLQHQVVLAGHSLGAALALEFAARWPHRVSGLILAGLGMRLGIDPEAIEATRRGEWPTGLWEKQVGPLAPPEVQRRVRRDWLATRPEVRHWDLVACAGFHAVPVANRAEAPTLVIGGEADPITPPETVRALWAALPAAELVFLPEVGHMLMEEDAPRFNQVVLQFLRQVHLPPRPVLRRL